MATSILYNAVLRSALDDYSCTQDGNISEKELLFKYFMNGNDDMAKSHDLLVMLG